MHDVVIIGTGPAGLTAAIYAARANLKPVIYAGVMHGGQLTTTTEVENFPGFEHGIMGPKLMTEMTSQAERFGTQIIYETITKVDFSKQPFKLWADQKEIKAKAVIIATGATAKTLGLPGESQLMGRGLSTCATCDGFFYRNKVVAVTGGGDSAMEESLTLAKFASKVTLVHRRDEFRASKIMLDRVKKHPKIDILLNTQVVDVLGKDMVEGVVIQDTLTDKQSEISCQGFFVAIGHTPATKLFDGILEIESNGYLKSSHDTSTKIKGVFATGDVTDSRYRQAITAAGEGCKSALEAEHYIENT
jgi:thioredoxin reductase (NADPH)